MDFFSIISNTIEKQLKDLDNNRKEIIINILGKKIAVNIDKFENNTNDITNSILQSLGIKQKNISPTVSSPVSPVSPVSSNEFNIIDPVTNT